MAAGNGARSNAAIWQAARRGLDGLPGGGINIAHEAVVRHAQGEARNRIALRALPKRGDRRELTYGQLHDAVNRFANGLASLGVAPGGRVFLLAGRVPELHVAAMGALAHRAVVCPLFSAFGPEPIRQRLSLGEAEVLVTTRALYDRKVASMRSDVPSLRLVVLIDGDGGDADVDGIVSWQALLEASAPHHEIAPTDPETPALLHFTSGTTGTPKGVVHVHDAVVAHHATAAQALGLRAGDVFWCTADPGWVTGTSYGIVAPLTHGATVILDEGELDVDRWYATLERERVQVWYTAPTALRMLMRAGTAPIEGRDLSALRTVASVGEPLNPEVVLWGRSAYGLDILDNWWQTETGGIMIANRPGRPVAPGSMGTPIDGIEAAVLRRGGDGEVLVVDGAAVEADIDVEGELALRPGWPSMFRGYLGMDERYRRCFVGGWYLSGDLARRDGEGRFWFVGRSDDVIKSAGHLIGPFEVESALMEHPAVAEVGVIGVPDAVVGAVVKAFVVPKQGIVADEAFVRELMAHARRRLGPAVAPREIALRDALPRTRSGKIMRRLLRARELGLPEGDLSMLEGNVEGNEER